MVDKINKEARIWGMWCHLASLVWIPLVYLSFIGIPPVPFAHILGPLVVWLWKKKEHPFIDEQGKESLNFQISFTIYWIVLVITAVVVGIISVIIAVPAILKSLGNSNLSSGKLNLPVNIPIDIPMNWYVNIWIGLGLIAMVTFNLVIVFAAIKARGGKSYRYPWTIRLIQ